MHSMMERAQEGKLRVKRGPYKRYLKDPHCAVPKTSWWRVRKHIKKSQKVHSPVDNFSTSPSDKVEVSSSSDEMDPAVFEDDPAIALFNEDGSTIPLSDEGNSICSQEDDDPSDHADHVPSGNEELDSDVNIGDLDSDIACSDSEPTDSNFSTPDFKNLFDPIYKDASITLCGAFCAIMEFKRACRLPFTAIKKLLHLLQLFCPPDNTLPKTVYEIKKFFGNATCYTGRRKYCADCDQELQEKQKYCSVDTCRKREPSTLVVLDPAKSIKRVLKRNWEDVNAGTCGITFNTDGISPFKSSNLTIWPIIIALTTLPPRVRWNKDNLIVLAFWVGEKKPHMPVLFSPLIDALRTLSETGIKISTPGGDKNITFQPLFGSFDFVAKAPILNMHQFNGSYGCPSCLNPGITAASRYYMPDSDYDLRTNETVVANANEADSKGEIVNGIKGQSILSGIIDLVQGVPIALRSGRCCQMATREMVWVYKSWSALLYWHFSKSC